MPQPQLRPELTSDAECPVPLDTLGAIYRGDREEVDAIVAGIPPRTRARLASYLYSKSHLHAIGLRVAATCDEFDLVQVAGVAGSVLYAQSRTRTRPAEGRAPATRRVSLAGSLAARGAA
ncbi:hypothetical protein [uncultured Methylobacterium sp.]|jgi:hypothetical protein|uniref:hypothetical protein n=1 Tax=uncultured Methylobacterium sp. TaxID=157278 RepID=UPI002613EC7F|nr:hypothetical protein [uncultured Methylobacterium sp.]